MSTQTYIHIITLSAMADQIKEEQVDMKEQSIQPTTQIANDNKEVKYVEDNNDAKENKPRSEKRSIGDDDKKRKEEHEDTKEIKKLKTENKEKKVEEKDKDKKQKDEKKQEKEKIEIKPKFVFGAATSFGSGFKIVKNIVNNNNDNNSNDDDDDENKNASENDKKDNKIISPNVKQFAFGSQFSFGSGFNILKEKKLDGKKPANLQPASSKNNDHDKNDSDKKSIAENKEPEKNVKLHKQEVKSGEETETCLFQANMKLYQLHNIKEGWKEKGVGTLKLNKDDTTQKSRIVMRSRGILKVILNLPLLKGFSIKKGFPGSLQSEKFIRIIALDDKNLPVTYALKCGNPSLIDELYDKIEELIQKV